MMLEFWTPDAAATMFDALQSQAHSLTYLRLYDLCQDQYHLLLQLLPVLTNLETLQFTNFRTENDDPIKYL